MQEIESEVLYIRKLLSACLLILFLVLISPKADAATLNSKAGAVTTTGGNLNVRTSASSGAAVVASLKKGSFITLLSKAGSWWKVEYAKGKTGYCHENYITVVQGSPVTVRTVSGSLNVRSGPGMSYGRVATLTKEETVIFLKSTGDWSRVLYHGTNTGYVSARYLSNYLSPVSLSIPNLKQMDARWAEKTVGESGKTFAQIGCATTAIAMMESFRMGTTVYPDTMAKKLRYTASGNVYWPEHYRSVTESSGYLDDIYSKLKQGKPVLLGATNGYGSQHWIVVSGFTGGVGLNASGFTIQDPGTYSRNNLSEFLDAYPKFYKYFYY